MNKITEEQIKVLELLKRALNPDSAREIPRIRNNTQLSVKQWEQVVQCAKTHAVLSLLYEELKIENIPGELFRSVQSRCKQTVMQNYRLLYLTNRIVKLLEKENITVLVLKGVSAAVLYPYPELRKSGDVDLLIVDAKENNKAHKILEIHGFIRKKHQNANHHTVYQTTEGVDIELHSALVEPFDNQAINQYLQNLSQEFKYHKENKMILGSSIPVPTEAYQAYYLLLHMLQHFLRSGFGLKLLCDWTVFWNRDTAKEVKEEYLRLVGKSGLRDFSEKITELCICYLGLKEERASALYNITFNRKDTEELLIEILEAQEFGKSGKDRMVVLRGTSPSDYLRELHHQMCLNYPKAGRYLILWPILWAGTLTRFLVNNRKIRKISAWAILRKAHSRSKRRKNIRLFENMELETNHSYETADHIPE